MIEIKNKLKSPVQIVVRSRTAPRAFTTLIIPGVGKGNNIRLIEDEAATDVIERVEKLGLISTRYVPNNEIRKGD
jgi:sulfate adenylyltransferase subunit 1 (EFTu-like GTPase family)